MTRVRSGKLPNTSPGASKDGASLRINARVSANLVTRVQRLAEQDGSTITDIVEAALQLYCATNEARPTALEVWSAAGLIGAAQWSENASTTVKADLTTGLKQKRTPRRVTRTVRQKRRGPKGQAR